MHTDPGDAPTAIQQDTSHKETPQANPKVTHVLSERKAPDLHAGTWQNLPSNRKQSSTLIASPTILCEVEKQAKS